MEKPGKSGRSANEVAGGDGQALFVTLAQFGELCRQVFGTAGGGAVDGTGRGCLEMAVIIIDAEDLQFDGFIFESFLPRLSGSAETTDEKTSVRLKMPK